LAEVERALIIALSIREGAMLHGLMLIGEVLIGAWIVATGWVSTEALLEKLNKASLCASYSALKRGLAR